MISQYFQRDQRVVVILPETNRRIASLENEAPGPKNGILSNPTIDHWFSRVNLLQVSRNGKNDLETSNILGIVSGSIFNCKVLVSNFSPNFRESDILTWHAKESNAWAWEGACGGLLKQVWWTKISKKTHRLVAVFIPKMGSNIFVHALSSILLWLHFFNCCTRI